MGYRALLTDKVMGIKSITFVLCLFAFSLIGIILNIIYPFDGFGWNLAGLNLITLLSFYYFRYYMKSLQELSNLFPATATNLRVKISRNVVNNIKSIWLQITGIAVGFFFGFCSYKLASYKLSPTAIFGSILVTVSTVFSISSYIFYIFHQYILYLLATTDFKIHEFNQHTPLRTEWFQKAIQMNTTMRDGFLIIGLIYTIQYMALIVTNDYFLRVSTSVLKDFYFMSSWGIILLFIFSGFAIFNFYSNTIINKISNRIETKIISKLSAIYADELETHQKSKEINTSLLEVIDRRITEILVPKPKVSIAFEAIKANLLYLITICVHFTTIYWRLVIK